MIDMKALISPDDTQVALHFSKPEISTDPEPGYNLTFIAEELGGSSRS